MSNPYLWLGEWMKKLSAGSVNFWTDMPKLWRDTLIIAEFRVFVSLQQREGRRILVTQIYVLFGCARNKSINGWMASWKQTPALLTTARQLQFSPRTMRSCVPLISSNSGVLTHSTPLSYFHLLLHFITAVFLCIGNATFKSHKDIQFRTIFTE